MALLENGINFTGSINGMSAYRMKGCDKIVLRSKGGASKKKIKRSPSFKLTRLNNTEFGGCAKAASSIKQALFIVSRLADYNFTPVLNALSKRIQLQDKVNERGKRAINFSEYPYLLEGFQLNKKNPFDSVVRQPLHYAIERSTGSAVVQLPALLPGLNLVTPWPYPFYRFVIGLATITDRTYKGIYFDYRNADANNPLYAEPLRTEWYMAQQPFVAQRFELQINKPEALDNTKTLLLSIGIEMGMPVTSTAIERVKYAGCAKIAAAG